MSELALEVESLAKVYASRGEGPIRAVDGMSLRVPSGIIFGLLGPNGAGKSTLLRMLSTLTRPTEGTAKILGYDVVKKPIEVRKRISSVIQATAVELFLSVKDNLLTYARFQGLDKAVAARRADALIEEFQLGPEVDRKVQDLSGGFRRSEEHTSELQSQSNLVCRLLLEKKKKKTQFTTVRITILAICRIH